jgi:hypothetical protein
VFQEPQQSLAHGGEFREFGEDQRDRLLDTAIRILLKLLPVSLM